MTTAPAIGADVAELPPGAAETIAAIKSHHAQLSDDFAHGVDRVREAVERLAPVTGARDDLLGFITAEVLPHAAAEEATLYGAGEHLPASGLLVKGMIAEHRVIMKLTDALAAASTPAETVAAAAAVHAVFEAHLAKENDLLLPALVAGGVDIAALLEGMHDLLGGHAEEVHGGCGCGNCGCGGGGQVAEDIEPGDLDVRQLPHGQRHEVIFTMLGRLEPGQYFILANDHDPKPLRYQLEAQHPDTYFFDYLQSGPDVWRVRIGRVSAAQA
ncbi:MAG TPA: DUF2249 domain-containing protein [Actinomycetes bacterium]|nr:DUF2249 domain-containing protein [Actinomycetes bacterium]